MEGKVRKTGQVRGFGTWKNTTEVFLENQVCDGVILEQGSECTS